MSATAAFLIVTAVTLFLGVPIGAALMLALMALIAIEPCTTTTFIAQSMYSGMASIAMICIPFFCLCGSIMDVGGLSKRLVNFANSFVGNVTGGLGMVTILSCMLFGAVSGSAVATTAAIGTIMIPQMVRNGYDKYYATALVVTAGGLGVVVPPSYPLVLYGITNNVSIGDLFLAGVLPAIVVGGILMGFNYYYSRKNGWKGSGEKVSLKNILLTFKDSVLALLMPVIILGGIYSGVFTATEASVIACVYGIIVGKFIYKALTWRAVWDMLKENVAFVGGTMLVFAPATALGRVFAYMQYTTAIQHWFTSVSSNINVIMLMILFVLLIAGMFVQTSPIIIILTPMMYSLVTSMGVHPVHFGIIVLIALCIAFVTPPVASNLYVGVGLTGLPLAKIVKRLWPYIIALIIALLIITYTPGISLFLIS